MSAGATTKMQASWTAAPTSAQIYRFTINANASCPYSTDLCAYNGHSAMQMDTELLDTLEDFGINAPPQNRIKYRRVTTCAPVKHGSGLGVDQNDSTWGQVVYIQGVDESARLAIA
ncbi:uncharacterized protein BP01DRAFT_381006 [Aspergillus saccharolyticus JOP 1030-1]|uniref:Uncharacterized protein n=1 Tax=Aspergillus saccharolyticus JOP 1030-1 TaxID=1450539 RepID=A0A318ZK44_9EURO|nr:hypothetical protein BP01DRAFT_381006 [Aspergillus saccharolyticus JOP 1030-1]PYH47165.1 hypothetical protein BP01DRAFT_381006 [Aspergillus saccharolyticus JOP 1030-1]